MPDEDLPPTIITEPPVRAVPSSGMTEPPAGADNYLVGREIARGGMGSVLEAEDAKLKRTVAVKVMLLDACASDAMRQRFLREAEVLALLAHPNIVPIYDIVWEHGQPLFYCMKLVKGRTLQAILNDLRAHHPEALREFTLDRLLLIFRKVCDALAFAHSKGVLHRDLKPENVMVGEFGEVLVMDWGLARLLRSNDETRMTNDVNRGHDPSDSTFGIRHSSFRAAPDSAALQTLEGAVMGTPQYMSPEQAMGHIDELDERSDLFSLGGILYAILTLRPPVEGKTLDEVLNKVRTAEITSPSELKTSDGKASMIGEVLEAKQIKPLPHTPGGRVPAALSSVVMKALQLDKAKRYPTVSALSADIEAYQSGFATSAEQAGTLKQLKLLMLRHKGVTAALAAMLVLSAGFVLKVMAKEAETRAALVKSSLALADSYLAEADGRAMRAALNVVPEKSRDSTWRYLMARSDTSIAHIGPGTMTSVSADPTRPSVFAIASEDMKVIVLNVLSGERLLEFEPEFTNKKPPSKRLQVAFSENGQWIAIARENPGGVVVHRASDGRKERAWAAPNCDHLEWGAGSDLLLNGSYDLQLWNAATGRIRWQQKRGADEHLVSTRAIFMPDKQKLLAYSHKLGLRLISAQDGSAVRTLKEPWNGGKWSMCVHPDGTLAYACGDNGIVHCIELEAGKTLFSIPGTSGQFRAGLGIGPDKNELVLATPLGSGLQAVQVHHASTGAPIRSLLGGMGSITGMAIHPSSGELLISGPNTSAWALQKHSAPLLTWISMSSFGFLSQEDTVLGCMRPPHDRPQLLSIGPGSLKPLWTLASPARSIEVSADGKMAAFSEEGWGVNPVQLLRLKGGNLEAFATLPAPPAEKCEFAVMRMRLSPRGDRLAMLGVSERFEVRTYETASGRKLQLLEQSDMLVLRDLRWIADGKELLGAVTAKAQRGEEGSEEWLVRWDADSGKLLQTLPHPTPIEALAVAPDGQRFAEAGFDKQVRIRDAKTLAVQQAFRVHDDVITSLAWHPKRPVIATGSTDLTVRLWDLETTQMLKEWLISKDPGKLGFSATGKYLVANFVGRLWLTEEDAQPARTIAAPSSAPALESVTGLISPRTFKILRFSSENTQNQKLAKNAIDGDPATLWHSRFDGEIAQPPHELVIDLGAEHTIRGFLYLARKELTPNVAKDIDYTVSNDPNAFTTPPVKATLRLVREPQITPCAETKARYLRVRILSSQDGNAFASAAEIGVIGE